MQSIKINNLKMYNINTKLVNNINIIYPEVVQIQMEDYCYNFRIVILNKTKIQK